MDQRKCAACGKLFTPKGRERYCDGPHYKPCPVCGEMVIAVYWSDPPKRCKKCRASNAKVATSRPVMKTETSVEVDNPTMTIDLNDNNVREYVGPEGRGVPFHTGHRYIIKLEHEEKYGCYVVTSDYDITSEEEMDGYMRYGSMIMVNKYFQEVETNGQSS